MLRSSVPAFVLAAAVAGACGAASPQAPLTAPAPDGDVVAAIEQLGAPDPAARDRASHFLVSKGKAVVPALLEAATRDDPEVAARARAVLADVRLGITPATPQPVVTVLQRYQAGDREQKEAALKDLEEKTGPEGKRALYHLYAFEPDARLRGAIETRLERAGLHKDPREALAAGDDEAAELLMAGAGGDYFGDADYAAFLLLRGGLPSKIQELEAERRATERDGPAPPGRGIRVGESLSPGERRDILLAHLYTADRKPAAALQAAQRSGDRELVAHVALELGDPRPFAAWVEADASSRPEKYDSDVCMALAAASVARDATRLRRAAEEAAAWVDAQPDDAQPVIRALLLTDRRDDAVAVARRRERWGMAFEVLRNQGRFPEALQLVQEAEAAERGAMQPAAATFPAGAATRPVQTRRELEPHQVESQRLRARQCEGETAEQRVHVRAKAAALLWQLGKAEEAHAMADSAARAARELEERFKKRATVDAEARAELQRNPRPSPDLWAALAAAEQAIGRRDLAFGHAATALAVEEAQDQAVPRSKGTRTSLSTLYPGREDEVTVWGDFLRLKFAHEPPAACVDRLRAVLERTIRPEQLADWARELRAGAVDSTSPDASRYELLTLAETLTTFGRVAEARECLWAAAEQSKSAEPWRRLGEAAMSDRDWPRAADCYAEAHRYEPSGVFLYLHSVALRRAGRALEADRALASATLLPLGDEWRRVELAAAMEAQGDPAAAREQVDLALRAGGITFRHRHGNALRLWANRQARAGHFAWAAAALERANLIMFQPHAFLNEESGYLSTRQVLHTWRARGLLQAGDVAAAVREAQEATDALPADADVAIELVNDFDHRGRRAEADALFRRCWGYHKGITAAFPRYGQGHNAAAWMAARCGREPAAALEHATTAVELEPRNAAFIDTLAEACLRNGRREEAVAHIRKCLELSPGTEYYQWRMRELSAPSATAPTSSPDSSP